MKFVYLFQEGDADLKNLLGGKGGNLCEMTKLKLPVPQGFVVSTEACLDYYEKGMLTDEVKKQILNALEKVEKQTNRTFGDGENPLLLSIRSGAKVSMPGMMDTILDLGLTDKTVKTFAKTTTPFFAYDCYRRFIQMYGNVVMGIDDSLFEKEIAKIKKTNKVKTDQELTAENLQELIKNYKVLYKEQTKKAFPQDIREQLLNCVESVFKSWNNERAKTYRKINNIPDDWGTAVNVQMMVFGNLNNDSGTGVCFSRNPSSGENIIFGEFLMNAQGEDIVAGIRTPQPIQKLKDISERLFIELQNYLIILENYYKDMQDIEFTIENGKLWILQTRNGKRTASAGIKIAVDLANEGHIEKETAIQRIEPEKISELLHSNLELNENHTAIADGIPASPGGASGRICLTSKMAKEIYDKGENAILVRKDTSPEDIEGMAVAEGILTATGGMTSHAAVVARGMGKVCVSGCEELEITAKTVRIGSKSFKEGDYISIDGNTGKIYGEKIELSTNIQNKELETLLSWAKEKSSLKVYANADSPKDTQNANFFGAEGIGLCRTEHMFFGAERIKEMRKMILSKSKKEREAALKKLLPLQKSDFEAMFRTMNGKPLTIRLLDPPLHEFLPKTKAEIKEIAAEMGIEPIEVETRIEALKEVNPMLGHRGLRLAVTYPEIYEMQTKAICQGAIHASKKVENKIDIEIMIPLTSDINEFLFVKEIVKATAEKTIGDKDIGIKIGTMIETPRAVMIASDLASECDFFSFGTNDLTQLTYGFSRDDSGKFLDDYVEKGIFKSDIFKSIDTKGVGKLLEMAITSARRINPNIKIGICGEHAGDPLSIKFFKKLDIDYRSCSVFRVPVAIVGAI